ncbi:hypothetical protein ACRAWF_13760 [Streptomyces sp. L7]
MKKVQKDRIDPKKRSLDKYVQFGAASVRPKDGRSSALYRGDGYENGHFTNNADTSGVPVGFDLEAVRARRGHGVRHVQDRWCRYLAAQQVQRRRPSQGQKPGRLVRPEQGTTRSSTRTTRANTPGATSRCARRWSSPSTRRTCSSVWTSG